MLRVAEAVKCFILKFSKRGGERKYKKNYMPKLFILTLQECIFCIRIEDVEIICLSTNRMNQFSN